MVRKEVKNETDWIILEAVDENNQPVPFGTQSSKVLLTDDILTFDSNIKIAPLSLYAVLKEIHGIERFQIIQHSNNHLQLRLIANNKQQEFLEAKQA